MQEKYCECNSCQFDIEGKCLITEVQDKIEVIKMTKCNNKFCGNYNDHFDNNCDLFGSVNVCGKQNIQPIEHLKELSNHCKSVIYCDECSLNDYCKQLRYGKVFGSIEFKEV